MRIYVKASKIYHMKLVKICETLFCHTIILTNRFYIVNKSAQTTNLLYTLCVESFYVIPCFLVQFCDLFRSKGGSVILEGLVIPFLQLVALPTALSTAFSIVFAIVLSIALSAALSTALSTELSTALSIALSTTLST